MADAIENNHKYILKPQLEGGAGNFHHDDVTDRLREFNKDERAAHILMERITPIVVKVRMKEKFDFVSFALS